MHSRGYDRPLSDSEASPSLWAPQDPTIVTTELSTGLLRGPQKGQPRAQTLWGGEKSRDQQQDLVGQNMCLPSPGLHQGSYQLCVI